MKVSVLLVWAVTAVLVWLRLPSMEVVTLQTMADLIAAGLIGFMGAFIGLIAGSVSISYSEAKARVSANAQKRDKR